MHNENMAKRKKNTKGIRSVFTITTCRAEKIISVALQQEDGEQT